MHLFTLVSGGVAGDSALLQTMSKFEAKIDVLDKPDAVEDLVGQVPSNKRSTSRYMTKYEKARLLGMRALRISNGAKAKIDVHGETDPLVIAELELKAKALPMFVRRYLPDATFEDWFVDELLPTP